MGLENTYKKAYIIRIVREVSMESKLTLKLNSGSISRAKKYVHRHKGYSLSKLVENYFDTLTKEEIVPKSNELPPIVSGLDGVAKKGGSRNAKDDYTDYLMEKYK
jgi:hypothetical protein